jgi:hypothetical protein
VCNLYDLCVCNLYDLCVCNVYDLCVYYMYDLSAALVTIAYDGSGKSCTLLILTTVWCVCIALSAAPGTGE